MRSASLLISLAIGLAAANHAHADALDPAHATNDLYQALLGEGATLATKHVAFPRPLVRDGDAPDVERAALLKLAGSEAAMKEFLRDSVSAPQILRVRDEKAADGTILRLADVWFAIHAGLDEIDPSLFGGKADNAKPVEAGNMRFVSRMLGEDDLKPRHITRATPTHEWYAHMTGDLLGRIHVESTDRVLASRAKDSWVFASRTDARFDDDQPFPNQWWSIERAGNKVTAGKPERFAGGASTTKISRLATAPGTLLVEGHFAFAEPHAWFDGAPILRAKIAVVAQDQIRRLRRELAQRKTAPKP